MLLFGCKNSQETKIILFIIFGGVETFADFAIFLNKAANIGSIDKNSFHRRDADPVKARRTQSSASRWSGSRRPERPDPRP
jgi:hypothetical protein